MTEPKVFEDYVIGVLGRPTGGVTQAQQAQCLVEMGAAVAREVCAQIGHVGVPRDGYGRPQNCKRCLTALA